MLVFLDIDSIVSCLFIFILLNIKYENLANIISSISSSLVDLLESEIF